MKPIVVVLLVAGLGFAAYAWYTHSTTAAPGAPLATRVKTALIATAIALAGSFVTWLQSLTP